MIDFTYQSTPIKLFFGEGKLAEVVQGIRGFGTKVLLVFGGSSFKKNGYYQKLINALTKEGVTTFDFSGNTYPSLLKVREGIDLCRTQKIDCVVGIGGGTCMDIAKAIAFGTMQDEDIFHFLSYELSENGRPHLPVGTIVTYPSSSSEMNGAAQITDDETQEKYGLSSVYPNFSWLNPEYMMSIDTQSLVYGQLTAFVQISSWYISLEEAELTETMSASLLKSILDNLKRATQNSQDKEARSNLMLSTAMSMSGITTFGKTWDWTLMPLTGLIQNYLDIPYTKALTIIFPYFIKEVYSGERIFKSYFQNVLDVSIDGKSDGAILKDGLDKLWETYHKFGVATTFKEHMNIPDDNSDLVVSLKNMGIMQSQYGTFTPERLGRILLNAIG